MIRNMAMLIASGVLGLVLASAAHEFGHALGLWICGRRLLVIQIGSGRKTLAWPRIAPRVLLCGPWPFGGRCCARDGGRVSRGALVLERLAGSLANLVLATGLLLGGPRSGALFVVAGVQLCFGLAQLLPLPQHDGAVLLNLVRDADMSGDDRRSLDDEIAWLQEIGHPAAAQARRRALESLPTELAAGGGGTR